MPDRERMAAGRPATGSTHRARGPHSVTARRDGPETCYAASRLHRLEVATDATRGRHALVGGLLGALGGAALGALVGAALPARDRWRPVVLTAGAKGR